MEDAGFKFWLDLLLDEGVGFLGSVIVPTGIGVLLGLALALLVYGIFRLVRLINAETPGLAKAATLLWLLLLLPIALGFAGFQKGLVKGVRTLVTEGRLAQEVVPEVGGGVADVVFLLDESIAHLLDGEPLREETAPPRQQLDVALFLDRCQRGGDRIVDELLPPIVEEVKGSSPLLSEGIGGKLIDWIAETFGEQLVRGQIEGAIEQTGYTNQISRWIEGLPAAAAETDGDHVITRGELASYTIESLILTILVEPLDFAAKFEQILGIGAVILIIAVPAAGLLIQRYLVAMRRRDAEAEAVAR